MSAVHVSALVASIVSAFATGTEILERMRVQKTSKKFQQKPARWTQEAQCQLRKSLRHRPKEILAEYDKNLSQLGDRFAIGDSPAQTALNQALLALNAGLIQILSHCLSNHSQNQPLSSQSLLRLSETAATDSMQALDQLHARLTSATSHIYRVQNFARQSHLKASEPRCGNRKSTIAPKPAPGLKSHSKSGTHIDRKRPAPDLVVRGAWVRSKSSASIPASSLSSQSSAVVLAPLKISPNAISPALNQEAAKKPSHHRRIRSSITTSSTPSRNYSKRSRHLKEAPRLQPKYSSLSSSTTTEEKASYSFNRQPSMLIVSSEAFANIVTQSSPEEHRSQKSSPPARPPKVPFEEPCPKTDAVRSKASNSPPVAPRPPKIPAHSHHHSTDSSQPNASDSLPAAATATAAATGSISLGSKLRHRPPSTSTLQSSTTASTNIGEIPEHKWLSHRYRQQQQQQQQEQEEEGTLESTTPFDWEEDEEDELPPTMMTKKKGWGNSVMKFWRGKRNLGEKWHLDVVG